jgi:hypothetical protein
MCIMYAHRTHKLQILTRPFRMVSYGGGKTKSDLAKRKREKDSHSPPAACALAGVHYYTHLLLCYSSVRIRKASTFIHKNYACVIQHYIVYY